MAMNVSSNYSSMFQAMNGKYNFSSDMSNVISQSSQIRSGSYGKLMKSYVNKVGNQNALKAFRETGTTVQSAQDLNSDSSKTSSSTSASTSTSTTKKPNFLDNYLSGKMGTVTKKESASSTDASTGTSASTGSTTSTDTQTSSATSTTDKYANLKSSWLDNQLKGYSSTGAQTVMADPAIAINTGV